MRPRLTWILPAILALGLIVLIMFQPKISKGTAEKTPKGAIAMHLVGWLHNETIETPAPARLETQLIGFLSYVMGLPRNLFCSDCPPDAWYHTAYHECAYFTFKTREPITKPYQWGWFFTHGYHTFPVIQPESFDLDVYYDPTPLTPERDMYQPETFAPEDGQLIATFRTEPAQVLLMTVGRFVFSAELTSSADFTFEGQKYNFKNLVPDGITVNLLGTSEKHQKYPPDGAETFMYGGSATSIVK